MALFNRKPTSDDIIKALKDLSEEDKDKVNKSLNGEQTVKDRVDESVAMQEKDSGDKDSQNAKDRVDESLGEKSAESGTTKTDVLKSDESKVDEEDKKPSDLKEETEEEHEAERESDEAANSRMEALENQIANLAEQIDKIVSHMEDKPFGESPKMPQKDDDEDDDRIMKGYYGAAYKRAKV